MSWSGKIISKKTLYCSFMHDVQNEIVKTHIGQYSFYGHETNKIHNPHPSKIQAQNTTFSGFVDYSTLRKWAKSGLNLFTLSFGPSVCRTAITASFANVRWFCIERDLSNTMTTSLRTALAVSLYHGLKFNFKSQNYISFFNYNDSPFDCSIISTDTILQCYFLHTHLNNAWYKTAHCLGLTIIAGNTKESIRDLIWSNHFDTFFNKYI